MDAQAVDQFSLENQIERIDPFRIETEGFDLEVVKGAQTILSDGQVFFVLGEVGFHPGDPRHVLFHYVRSYVVPMGYMVFGICNQQQEFSGKTRPRYPNCCLCKESADIGAIA